VRAAAIPKLAFAATLILGLPVRAQDACAVGEAAIDAAGSYAAAVERKISAAPDCFKAFQTLDACQLGSSGDNALSEIVVGKCEPLFLAQGGSGKVGAGKSGATLKARYRAAQKHCDRIAENNSGTMYQSFAAVCRARAARDFARRSGARLAK
jgi:hypothetical protein